MGLVLLPIFRTHPAPVTVLARDVAAAGPDPFARPVAGGARDAVGDLVAAQPFGAMLAAAKGEGAEVLAALGAVGHRYFSSSLRN